MALIRALLLVVIAAVSITWGQGAGEDRIGTLLSMMADMRNHVNSLTDSVKNIYRMEEETAEHMLKTEDRVEEIVKNEGEMTKKVERIVQNEGEMTKKVGNIETQMSQMKTQIAQVDDDVVTSYWKFIGNGWFKSYSGQVKKYGTTLQQCITFCTKKRQESGASWNGMWWIQSGNRKGECGCNNSETGHQENPIFLHFKV